LEMVVVLTVFVIIITAAGGLFISLIQQQNHVLAEQELYNQVSYAIEYMGRLVRTAQTDDGTHGCSVTPGVDYALTHASGGSPSYYQGIKFLTNDNNPICEEFYLDTDGIFKETKTVSGVATTQNLLSTKFQIVKLRFILDGSTSLASATYGDGQQPRVTILIDVKIPTAGNVQEKIIQTTLSQRNLNTGL